MSRERKIYNLVKEILTEYPPARDNDDILVCEFYRSIGVNIERPFRVIILNRSLPTVESITRMRRRVQEDCIELRASEFTQRRRARKTDDVLEFLDEQNNQKKQS